MSKDWWCQSCGAAVFDFGPRHVCPPFWSVREIEWDDDEPNSHVYAQTAIEAAEKWVERRDWDGDYRCLQGDPMEVRVRLLLTDPWQVFEVTGETVADYTAREKGG